MNRILKILTVSGVVVAIIFLVAQNLAWSGKLVIKTDFLKFTPYFSVLKPQPNIIMQTDANYIHAQPVYFDLYIPRDFDKAKIEIEYKNEFGYKILIGPNLKGAWDTKALEDLPSKGNDYKIKSIDFDLAKANINNGKLRFMISAPDLDDSTKGIYIKNLKVTLTRQPIWQSDVIQNLVNYFNYARTQN